MPRQGALVCGLVLMLAAVVPALSTAATKQHALEPSTHDAVGGVDLDEVPSRDLERAGECETATVSCDDAEGTAGRIRGKLSIVENCHQFFELDENGDAIMCRNNHGGGRDAPKKGTWDCITTNVGAWIFKKKTVQYCPNRGERHYIDKYCEPFSRGGRASCRGEVALRW